MDQAEMAWLISDQQFYKSELLIPILSNSDFSSQAVTNKNDNDMFTVK